MIGRAIRSRSGVASRNRQEQFAGSAETILPGLASLKIRWNHSADALSAGFVVWNKWHRTSRPASTAVMATTRRHCRSTSRAPAFATVEVSH